MRAVAALGLALVAASCGSPNPVCPIQCGKQCLTASVCTGASVCPDDAPCDPCNGLCEARCTPESGCTDPTKSCCTSADALVCVDVRQDLQHCGSCDLACDSTADACVDSTCVCGELGRACDAGQLCCGGACIAADAANCGRCGLRCGEGEACDSTAGACSCGATRSDSSAACAAGQTCCGDKCIDMATDATNCGACGNVCGPGVGCVAGHCDCTTSGCGGSQTCCSGSCASLTTDPGYCGSCTNACGKSETCMNGRCRCGGVQAPLTGGPACAASQTCCASGCANLMTSTTNCGACGVACGTGETCSAGKCTCGATARAGSPACLGATSCCSGACVNKNNDEQNCGSCGHVCSTTSNRCAGGTCECGFTGAACTAGCQTCSSTKCVFNTPPDVSIAWIQPQPTAGFGPANELIVAGHATGGCSGAGVSLSFRDITAGQVTFTAIAFAAPPDPMQAGVWYNSFPAAPATADYLHMYEIKVQYQGSSFVMCTYPGSNMIKNCP